MPESTGSASRRQSRANWVGLRTLHQVPKVVGETASGDPVFEVRSVRVVLPGNSNHFNRLANCAKCGREVPGAPVLSPADLDHHPHAVICRECVKAVSSPVYDQRRDVAAATVAESSVAPDPAPSGPVTPDDGRVDRLERRLVELTAQMESQRLAFDALVTRRVDQAKAEMAAATPSVAADPAFQAAVQALERSADVDRTRVDALDRRVDDVRDQLTAAAQAERADLSESLEGRLERLRADQDGRLERLEAGAEAEAAQATSAAAALAQANGELARLEDQVNERLDRRAERAARVADAGGRRLSALEDHLLEAVRVLGERFQAQRLESAAELEKGLADLQAIISAVRSEGAGRVQAVEKRVHEAETHLADLGELQSALDGGLGELRAAIEALRHDGAALAKVQAQLDERLTASSAAPTAAATVGGAKQPRSRRLGGRASDLNALAAAGETLAREHEALKAKLDSLEHATTRAVDAAATAASESSKLAPLRSHVRVLDDELSAQHDAVEALRVNVERLLRKPAAAKKAAPAARVPAARTTRSPRTTKG